ncbi:MAG: hypothetical protein WA982_16415 [Rubrobacteraceae bacterium]
MWKKRLKSLLAIAMIGEGVVAALIPQRYALLWLAGPRFVKQFDAWFVTHPGITRLLGVFEAGLGLSLAFRQNPKD